MMTNNLPLVASLLASGGGGGSRRKTNDLTDPGSSDSAKQVTPPASSTNGGEERRQRVGSDNVLGVNVQGQGCKEIKSTTKTHHRSPISPSLPPLPLQSSTSMLDHFGPLPQTLHDLLFSLGPTTLQTITTKLQNLLGKKENVDRVSLLAEVARLNKGSCSSSSGPRSHGFMVDGQSVKLCILTLLAHGIVKVTDGGERDGRDGVKRRKGYYYEVDVERGGRMGRYQRYEEHVKGSYGEGGEVSVVKDLCNNGRRRVEDIISRISTMTTDVVFV